MKTLSASQEATLRHLAERLRAWAQNNEMVDEYYTNHGEDCLTAATLLTECDRYKRERDVLVEALQNIAAHDTGTAGLIATNRLRDLGEL